MSTHPNPSLLAAGPAGVSTLYPLALPAHPAALAGSTSCPGGVLTAASLTPAPRDLAVVSPAPETPPVPEPAVAPPLETPMSVRHHLAVVRHHLAAAEALLTPDFCLLSPDSSFPSMKTKSSPESQPPSRSAARNGKIARLPAALRDQLGHRLDDGQPAASILAWLNAQPEAVKILRDQFGGVPVSPQNLSEWRAGGYLDWQRAQERLALARDFLAEAGGLGSTAPATVADAVACRLVLSLAALMPDEITPADLPRVVSLSKELDRHRRADRQQSLDGLRRAEWDAGAAGRARLAQDSARRTRRDEILAPVLAAGTEIHLRVMHKHHNLCDNADQLFAEAAEAQHGCPGALISPAKPPPPVAIKPPSPAPAKSPSPAAKPPSAPPAAPRASAPPVSPPPALGPPPAVQFMPFESYQSDPASPSATSRFLGPPS